MKKEVGRKSMKDQIISWSILLLFSFLFFGMWEWIQTPFYSEHNKTLNQVVWDRIHCTGGDILILLFAMLGSSILLRKNLFRFNFIKRDYLFVASLGTIYTIFSEYINVYVHQSWMYSSLMPLLPVIKIGVIPIVQWMLLPPLILYFVRNYLRNGGEENE